MNKITGMEIDINKIIDNLRIRLKLFKNSELSEELGVNIATFNGWVGRGSGDFFKVVLSYCKKNNISVDEILSDDILAYREKIGYERGLCDDKRVKSKERSPAKYPGPTIEADRKKGPQ
jgi:hypothetical protein